MQSQTRTSGGTALDLSGGTVLQVGYGVRAIGNESAALYVGAHFLASPQRRNSSLLGSATRDVASLYLTPQVTVKIAPASRMVPWAAFGGGYALYEQSTTRIDGQPNAAPRHISTGTWLFGAGLDIRLVRALALRGELRDFLSGSPGFNTPVAGLQHDVVVGAGVVVRF